MSRKQEPWGIKKPKSNANDGHILPLDALDKVGDKDKIRQRVREY